PHGIRYQPLQPCQREHPVFGLRSAARRNDVDPAARVHAVPEALQRQRAPSFVQRARPRDREGNFDARAALVDVLAAWPARARETDLQLVGRDRYRSGAEVFHLRVFALEYLELPNLALRRDGPLLRMLPVSLGEVCGLHPRVEVLARAPARVDEVLRALGRAEQLERFESGRLRDLPRALREAFLELIRALGGNGNGIDDDDRHSDPPGSDRVSLLGRLLVSRPMD